MSVLHSRSFALPQRKVPTDVKSDVYCDSVSQTRRLIWHQSTDNLLYSDADLPASEPRELEMAQLKRKSLGRSTSPDENGHRDAPAKRLKLEDDAGASPEAKEQIDPHGSIVKKNGVTRAQDTVLKQENHSLRERLPEESATVSGSPEQQRRPSESSRRERSPHQGSRSPEQFRRPSDSRRRGSTPPSARDRRESEASRRGSVSQQRAVGEKDRNRRRPEASRDEEKKRGKRLFGGLLSTLSQTTTNSQHKRRQEIEKKQQEKAAKQKIEDDQRRTERLAKLARIRKVEQVRFDEQVVSGPLHTQTCLRMRVLC